MRRALFSGSIYFYPRRTMAIFMDTVLQPLVTSSQCGSRKRKKNIANASLQLDQSATLIFYPSPCTLPRFNMRIEISNARNAGEHPALTGTSWQRHSRLQMSSPGQAKPKHYGGPLPQDLWSWGIGLQNPSACSCCRAASVKKNAAMAPGT